MIDVVIVGIPNVGKSTLFNRLVGRKEAITYNTPGVTRDYREQVVRVGSGQCRFIDTGGWDENTGSLASYVTDKIKEVSVRSSIIFFVIDNFGIGTKEFELASWLRKVCSESKIVLVVNKCEGRITYAGELDFFNDTIYVSAEHNVGISMLYDPIFDLINVERKSIESNIDRSDFGIAILGQPNSGKSTLVNRLFGSDRMIVSEVPGTTTDSVGVSIEFDNHKIELVDTAGVRKKAKVENTLEKLIVRHAIAAIKKADLVCLVIDASYGMESQDKRIINLVYRNNIPLIIVLNKWDLIDHVHREELLACIQEKSEGVCGSGVEVVTMSALYDQKVLPLLARCMKLIRQVDTKFSTASVNKWLTSAVNHHSPPLNCHKRVIKLKYANQVGNRPVTIRVVVNVVDFPENYKKYMVSSFRDYFKLSVIPIVFKFKKGDNPYLS